jgi:FkbM family methyltransferase
VTITSYAQNFEDIILWRALKHVERGFYIDIGAQDPVDDSVSLGFYEQGWRGVHIEPTKTYAEKLRQARPDEEVIEAAVGTGDDPIAFWEFPDTGLSTGDAANAEKQRRKYHNCVSVEVPCLRLSTLLQRYRDREIHWLKIDVEGMELAVIQSWRPSTIRPWVVVVESTKPNSQEENFASWEPLVVGLGYNFVYFDGLNRFYVSQGHSELKGAFGPGPNYFDDAVLSGLANTPLCRKITSDLAEAQSRNAALEDRLDAEQSVRAALESRLDAEQSLRVALDGRLDEEQSARAALEAHLDEERSARRALMARLAEEMNAVQVLVRQNGKLEGQLSAVYASTSWRIAAPLRSASLAVRWLGRGTRAWLTLTPGSRPRRVARRTLENLADSLPGQPRLRAAVVRLLPSSPVPDQQVQREEAPGHIATDVPQLSPRAQRIYLDLKAAIEKGKAE